MILGSLAACVLVGCQIPPRDLNRASMSSTVVEPGEPTSVAATEDAGAEPARAPSAPDETAESGPPRRTAERFHERPAVTAARNELGDEAADAVRETMPERHAPQPADPGAAAVVELIAQHLPADRPVDDAGMTRIGFEFLRNQSKCATPEFREFVQRFAELLTRAGRDRSLTFTADESERVDYQLLGSAYLNTVAGFDQWELYLRLSPADRAWTLWQPNAPVRVLRQPQPSRPQVTTWPTGNG
jgi:hypothetical protein